MSEARSESFALALVEAGADVPFEHDGLIYFHVPLWVVKAYAAARYARASELLTIVVAAHCGAETVAKDGQLERWLFWRIGRAWLWRLGQLERSARGLAARAVA